MKIDLFSQSALCASVSPTAGRRNVSKIVDVAWGDQKSLLWAHIINDDSVSVEAPFLTLEQAKADRDQPIFMVGNQRSIFGLGDIEQVAQTINQGYRVYPVEYHQHSMVHIGHLSNKSLSVGQIRSGSFRSEFNLRCRWDSVFGFVALPKGMPHVTQACLDELTNWINGELYAYEVLRSTKNQEGSYVTEVVDSCFGFYTETVADDEARAVLRAMSSPVSKKKVALAQAAA